jgi:hypothetical protein
MSKKSIFKITLTAAALLATSGYVELAQAHCIGNLGNFGASTITAIHPSTFQNDTFVAVCPSGTLSIVSKVSLLSLAASGPVSIEVGKGGYLHSSVSDATQGTAACNGALNESIGSTAAEKLEPSAQVYVNGGAGQYTINITKDSTTAVTYAAEVHCKTGLAGTGVEVNPQSQSALTLPITPAFNGLAVDRLAEFDRIMNH